MNPTKDEIKMWLKKSGHSREWLGQQCGKTKNTVNNWLSTNIEIPDGTLALISRLMADDAASEIQRAQLKLPANQIFSLEVSLDDFRSYSRAALAAGLTLEEWAIDECNRAAQSAALHEQSPEIPRYWIDLRGSVAAGERITGDPISEPISVDKNHPPDHYALKVCGASMAPKIHDGATIIVSHWSGSNGYPKKGTIVVYADGHGTSLKEFGYRKGSGDDEYQDAMGNVPVLRSLNKAYPEVTTMDGGRIEAVLVEVISR